jgi:hypothetical protein
MNAVLLATRSAHRNFQISLSTRYWNVRINRFLVTPNHQLTCSLTSSFLSILYFLLHSVICYSFLLLAALTPCVAHAAMWVRMRCSVCLQAVGSWYRYPVALSPCLVPSRTSVEVVLYVNTKTKPNLHSSFNISWSESEPLCCKPSVI